MPTITRWDGCYRDAWQDLIVPEAFAHPAKYSRGLIHRIYRHLLERGYVRPGQTVLDPFAGVGLGALDAMTYGLAWCGIELEERFCALANQNLALWRRRYGFTGGTVVQGDSRQLRSVLAGAQAGCVVGSPPFSPLDCQPTGRGQGVRSSYHDGTRKEASPETTYGTTPGQLGALPPGTPPACVVGSPPYAEALSGTTNLSPRDAQHARQRGRDPATPGSGYPRMYSQSPGQLGALPPGTPPSALVSSPPYAGAGQVLGTHNGIDYSKVQGSGKAATPARVASGEGYGVTPGQLGNMAVVSSPPYAESLHLNESVEADIARMVRKGVPVTGGAQSRTPVAAHQANQGYGHSTGQLGAMPAGAVISSPPYAEGCRQNGHDYHPERMVGTRTGYLQHDAGGYGVTPGNLGTEATTFWEAAAQIVSECAAILPVGGVACWVVKGYVSKGRLVDFPAQWLALCEAHGFRLVEEIHASLIEESGVQETLFGEAEKVQTERKSFFRRLHERKPGAVRIDHETVLILRKEA